MGDTDLDRIIADLQKRREEMARMIESTAALAPEGEKLVIAAEPVREQLSEMADRAASGQGEESGPVSVAVERRV